MRSPTRSEIQAVTRHFLDDANIGRTWTNRIVNAAINMTMQQLQKSIVLMDKGWFDSVVSFGLTEGVAEYTLPKEILIIRDVEFVSGDTVHAIPFGHANKLRISSTERGVIPQFYYLIGKRKIGFYPAPSRDIPYESAVEGPIRVSFTERVPRFIELDHPTTFLSHDIVSGVGGSGVIPQQNIASQALQGPAVSFEWVEVLGDNTFIPYRYYKVIAFFAKRREDQGRYSPPIAIGMPWVSEWGNQLVDKTTDSLKLKITKWPQGDKDNSEWPIDATHLELWLYVAGNPAHVIVGPTFPNNYFDVAYLGNILATDFVADGEITFNALGGAKTPTGPGEEGKGIWDGREYVVNEIGDDNTQLGAYLQRWINQIPPTPHPNFGLWPPYESGTTLAENPNIGSAQFFDTNPAKGDADFYHEDFFHEHLELMGALSAVNVLSRHNFVNEVLMGRVNELIKDMRDVYGSRTNAPRVLNITTSDPNSLGPGRRIRNLRE